MQNIEKRHRGEDIHEIEYPAERIEHRKLRFSENRESAELEVVPEN